MKLLYKKLSLVTFLLVALVFVLIISFISIRYSQSKSDYYSNNYETLNIQLESILSDREQFSDYIYDTLIDEYTISLFDEAYEADELRQNEIREELYSYLEEEYFTLYDYDFRQLHFHFPDSSSFLRMHAPSKFGDSLIGVRYSVEYTNTEFKYISGFEEGKIFNGYRFVYPLSNNDEHIGSVEVSISMSAVVNSLTDIYNSDYVFIMDKDVVGARLFEDQLDNYEVCSLSGDYLIDSGINSTSNRKLLTNDDIKDLFSSLSNNVSELKDKKDFTKIIDYKSQDYELIFHSVENIEGLPVAYFISISEGSGFRATTIQFLVNISVIIIAFVMISFALISIMKAQKLLYKISYTDKLTNIDNRHKLQLDFDREMMRLKRYSRDLSVLMLDIDFFKKINDQYGHKVGDEVLQELSTLIGLNIRNVDYFARYGGEEFVILLVESNLENSIEKAENLRKLVEEHTFNKIESITVSFGVYQILDPSKTLSEVIECVDKALYKAKENGRNRVSFVKQMKTPPHN